MSRLVELVQQARSSRDASALVDTIPYAQFIGFSLAMETGEPIGRMRFAPHLVGNPMLPALHGGTLGALLELTASFTLLMKDQTIRVPKTINLTVEYLRTGRTVDTFARAELTKVGRRVANLRVFAWQESPDKPVAAAIVHMLFDPPPTAGPG